MRISRGNFSRFSCISGFCLFIKLTESCNLSCFPIKDAEIEFQKSAEPFRVIYFMFYYNFIICYYKVILYFNMIAKKLIWSIPIFVLTDYILVVGPVFYCTQIPFPWSPSICQLQRVVATPPVHPRERSLGKFGGALFGYLIIRRQS